MDEPASPKDSPVPLEMEASSWWERRRAILRILRGANGKRLEVQPDDLMTRLEVMAFLPCTNDRIYQFVNVGLLHQVRRDGYQAYYLRSEVEALKRDLDGPGDGQDGPPSGGGPKGPQVYRLLRSAEIELEIVSTAGADVTSLREPVRRLVLSINVDLVAATGGRVIPERRPTWDQVVELRDAVRSQHAKAMEGHTHASIRPPTI